MQVYQVEPTHPLSYLQPPLQARVQPKAKPKILTCYQNPCLSTNPTKPAARQTEALGHCKHTKPLRVCKHRHIKRPCYRHICSTSLHIPPAPLANSRVSARRSPGWGGRRSPSDGLPGGGGIARVFQGKLWYPPLMQAKRTRVKRLSR